MLKVGLTGGIGAGKSEVSRLLVEHGAVLIDADRIAREVVAPGTPGLAAVVAAFGEDVLAEDGGLDRPKLGSIVFADPDRLAVLNSIVHPLVGARSRELESAAAEDAVVVHDVRSSRRTPSRRSTTSWSSSTRAPRPSSTGSSGCAA